MRLAPRTRMAGTLVGTLLVALAVVTATGQPAYADTQSVTVNFGSSTGSSPQYYGAGLLHGLNPDFPDAANLAPLKPYEWRLGDPGFISTSAVPPYDYFHVYGAVNAYAPHQVESIASDFINDPTYSSMTWNQRCNALATRAAGLGQHPDWDLFNEPEFASATWLSTGTTDWDNCYCGVRTGDATARIVGPSISSFNVTNIETFLLDQKAKSKLPDVVSWHFSAPENMESDVSTIKSFMAANGISARPIVIQEAMFSGSVGHPGQAIDYFAAAERAQVPVGHACWNETGLPNGNTCEEPMLDGLLDLNENRRGQWYAYADYSSMTGSLVSVTTSTKTDLDGLATKTSSQGTVLIGANDNWVGGTASVTLSGLASLSFLGTSSGTVRVGVQEIPQGMSAATQTYLSNTTYAYSGGTLTLSVPLAQYEGARIFVTAAGTNTVDSNWDDVGGVMTDSPAVASTGVNNLYAFVRGSDGALYTTTYNGSGWAAWTGSPWNGSAGDLGGPTGGQFVGAPAAVAWGGKVTVAVRGTDNALWVRTLSGGSWGSWTSLGGTLTSSPTLASQNSSDVEAFIRGTNHDLFQDSFNGSTWSGWGSSLGGPDSGTFVGDPSATSRANGVITVYTRAADNSVYEKFWTSSGGWSGVWNSIGGSISSTPDVSNEGSGQESLFARGTDGVLYRDTWSGSWSGWTAIGGPTNGVITGTPATVSWGSGRTDVLVWSADGPLYHRTLS